jgi:hypothetical protein
MIDLVDALLILQKWSDEASSLLFRYEATDAACAVTGTLSKDSESTWQVRSRKGDATLSFRVDSCVFEYVERRAVGSKDATNDVAERATLLVFFPPRFSSINSPLERSSLSISELLPSKIK